MRDGQVHQGQAVPDGAEPAADLAIPVFGGQSHAGIQGFGIIRTFAVTDAAAYEGRLLREGLLGKTKTAAWAVHPQPLDWREHAP